MTPPDDLSRLAADKDLDVRCAVAANTAVALADLDFLARSSDPLVRACVAGNARASVKTLKALAADPNWMVRNAVAGNWPRTPKPVLKKLMRDVIQTVAQTAERYFMLHQAVVVVGSR